MFKVLSRYTYRGEVIYWVKGSVHVLFLNLHWRGRVKGGNTNVKTKHTEPLTQEIPSALYLLVLKDTNILKDKLLLDFVQ